MFVEHHVSVPVRPEAAETALHRFVSGDGLPSASLEAYGHGVQLLRVGPAGQLTKRVEVRWLPPCRRNGTLVFPLRWEATGLSGGLFPTLDANLGVTGIDENTSLLSIVGTYHPPLGHLGERIDRTLLHRAAEATLQLLLRRIAADLAGSQPPSGRAAPNLTSSAPSQ